MRIYLARHAHSEWQLEPSLDWDTPLSALGHEQAKLLGRWLAEHERIDHEARLEVSAVVTSPLKRALQTAEYAGHALGVPVSVLDGLREADFHVSEHLPQTDTPRELRPREQPSAAYYAFKRRAGATFMELTARAESTSGPVLAIAHGGLIKTLLRLVVGADAASFRLYNTGLSVIEWGAGRWHLVHLNLWDHLPSRLRTR